METAASQMRLRKVKNSTKGATADGLGSMEICGIPRAVGEIWGFIEY